MSKSAPQKEKDQARAFRKAARELGAEATDEQFQDALRKIAKQRPVERSASTKKRSSGPRDSE